MQKVITLAPRLAAKLAYTPALPPAFKLKMLQTQTWMGNSAKCVIECKTAFWRKKSLSGFVFSHIGPLGEIHDASLEHRPALFGFINANADMQTISNSPSIRHRYKQPLSKSSFLLYRVFI